VREGVARSCQRVSLMKYTMGKYIPAAWSLISMLYKSSSISSVKIIIIKESGILVVRQLVI